MVWRYENATTSSSPEITKAIGVARLRAATPASSSVRRISSVAYATEESASEESTASPVARFSRSWCARCDGIGRPTTTCFRRPSNDSSVKRFPALVPALEAVRA